MIYNSFESLEGKKLTSKDFLIFAKMVYSVRENYLHNNLMNSDNFEIFRILGIEDPHQFCSRIYGYQSINDSKFPLCREGDYTALTKLSLFIFKMCEKNMSMLIDKQVKKILEKNLSLV